MSIRSTNVYESKSLGVFDESDDESEHEAEFDKVKPKLGTYIAYHARRQLSFDMCVTGLRPAHAHRWYLVLALFLIAIIEKDNIADSATDSYFSASRSNQHLTLADLFTIIFELSSAYGTVGLSLGTPNMNTSLSGEFRTLSKLVVCAVMIRGRHRGLPIAIDRAVLLPTSLDRVNTRSADDPDKQRLARRRRSSAQFSRFNTIQAQTIDEEVFSDSPPASPHATRATTTSLTFDESARDTVRSKASMRTPTVEPILSQAERPSVHL